MCVCATPMAAKFSTLRDFGSLGGQGVVVWLSLCLQIVLSSAQVQSDCSTSLHVKKTSKTGPACGM